MRPFKLAAGVIAVSSLAAVGGCVKTGDFWDHRVVLASDLSPTEVAGEFEGSWQSREFYDNGLIHFVIRPVEAAPTPTTLPAAESLPMPGTQRYLAQVKMWHYGIFAPECFDMVLTASPKDNGQIEFHGDRDLGPLMGFCSYNGFVDANRVTISYVTREDFGTVVLRRVVDR